MESKHRIVVGLSGGVDSSVAAWLLKRAGHEVVGVFMKNWEEDDADGYCTSRQDLVDAASAADVIGIELGAVNFAAEYRDRVFAQFLREYRAGRTPNPDVLCNSEIKFKAFVDHAKALGAERIATGHYARLADGERGVELSKSADAGKDQTYFLHQLSQAQLNGTMFPVGALAKRDVRAVAREQGIPTYAKKDSTGICFIGERPFREFLARYLPAEPGPIETAAGDTVGRHQGLAYYTLGQRQGLGVGGTRGAASTPWFVAGKDRSRNALIVVQGHDDPRLYADVVETAAMHRMADARCTVEPLAADRWRVRFDTPQWAPTPGQYLVLYDGETCLGGAVIESAHAHDVVPALAAAG